MGEILAFLLDFVLIGLLITGIVYATRLHRQLMGLRSSRGDMERFVADFSATVQRAEAGVRGLKLAAREGGDDLEQLINKAQLIRDELNFLVGSADQIANRLSDSASAAARRMLPEQDASGAATAKPATVKTVVTKPLTASPANRGEERVKTNAERELMQALEKLG